MIHDGRVIATGGNLPRLVEDAVTELPNEALLLDVGAGDGRMSEALSVLRPDLRVVGLEYDADLAINQTPDIFKNKLVVADAQSLPFAGGSFDAVSAVNILHEVVNASDEPSRQAQLQSTIAGISRVLTEDGSLIIYDGVMPDGEEEPLLVRPGDKEAADLLRQFKDEYVARPATFEESDAQPGAFASDMASVVTFLTKYDYLQNGEAWEGERHQLYPFTSLKNILEVLYANGLELGSMRFHEPHTRKGLGRLLARYAITRERDGQDYTLANFPACQMLLVTQIAQTI